MPKAASKYSISKHSDGRYRTKFTIDGKTIYIYGKTRNEVQTKLKAKLFAVEQAKASQLNNYMESEKMTVEQWARICLETYSKVSVRETTYAGYLSIIEHHLSPLGDYKLAEVTNAIIQAHLQREARGPGNEGGLGEKSLINIKAFLNLIFNQAVRNGYIMRNPVPGVKIPKAGKKETIALSVEQQHALLKAAREYPKPIMFAVVFALYTGCRRGEVMGLQWKDVDFDEGVIHISKQLNRKPNIDDPDGKKTDIKITEPKTKSSVRDIYMFPSFAKEFAEYKQKMIKWKSENKFVHSEEDFVFVGVRNTPIEPRVFYKYYEEVMKNAGIEDANFHTLRHTFATRCIENGMDILMVAKTLGHSNVSTTLNKYSHLLPKHQKASMEKLEAIYY